ncbi:MAG: 16S rRNA (guanine(966)-N(2))-methyltransferase RsmD, partial [candidate division Zixibacteria bacterium]|nr:16S rRNA (guanine(966)-N(2))-methyltransferase RsmD [candidate division Zixibacteria bacterium]
PSTDKTRQAIFNILSHETPGARVLDLFAGSGALGIEALSRGAKSAVFVDKSSPVIDVLKQNLKSLELSERVINSDWKKALKSLSDAGLEFELIFADPPYDEFPQEDVAAVIAKVSLLASEGILIIESSVRDTPASSLTLLKTRVFGHTQISFYHKG